MNCGPAGGGIGFGFLSSRFSPKLPISIIQRICNISIREREGGRKRETHTEKKRDLERESRERVRERELVTLDLNTISIPVF